MTALKPRPPLIDPWEAAILLAITLLIYALTGCAADPTPPPHDPPGHLTPEEQEGLLYFVGGAVLAGILLIWGVGWLVTRYVDNDPPRGSDAAGTTLFDRPGRSSSDRSRERARTTASRPMAGPF